jgi:GT2 family glycosyltransferase
LIDLSIVIVNWNTSGLLIQCLESIYNAELSFTYEIIVVDNDSTDNSVQAITDRYPKVRIIANDQNLGFAKANNQGIKTGKGRYFLLLNSDTILIPKSLDVLVHYAEEHLETGMVGPKLLNMDGTLQESWAEFPSLLSEITGKPVRKRHPIGVPPYAYDVDSILGACMLVREEVVRTIGLLDEEYFMYSEEVDWSFRIKSAGWRVHYYPAAEIFHIGGASASMNSLRQLSLLYQNKILFFNKNYGYFKALILRYGLALANCFGIARRFFCQYGKNRKAVLYRISIQSHLVWCLLRNKYPAVTP